MEKTLQNKGEGILGAIKAVTHKPVVDPSDSVDTTSVPGVTPRRSPKTRKPSSLIREIALSKTADQELREDNQAPEKVAPKMGKPEEEPVKPDDREAEKALKIPSSDRVDRAPGNQGTQPRGETVLPATRPAAVNRDIDLMLDGLNLQEKDTEYLIEKVRGLISNNLLQTESDDVCTPDMSIAGPVFNSLQYVVHQPQMVKLYSNLLSTAMSRKTARFAHPGFIDLIRNITEDEARVLSWFFREKVLPIIDIKKVLIQKQSEMRLNTLVSAIASDAGCEFDDLAEGYLANLERIGLLEIPRTTCLSDDSLYQRVLSLPAVEERLKKLDSGGNHFRGEVVKYYAKLSIYGIRFCHACIR